MQRDLLRAVKQFIHSFDTLKSFKITQKSLSDGHIFMYLLSNIDQNYFDVRQFSKFDRQVQKSKINKSHNYLMPSFQQALKVVQISKSSTNKNQSELNFLSGMTNWRILVKKIKEYFKNEHQKGIKYGDIDLADICKNHTIHEIQKVFQLLLCVVVNCKEKENYINRIMQLQQSTQQILAEQIEKALQTRLCSLQNQQKYQLIEELQSKQQENAAFIQQIHRLQTLNNQLQVKLDEFQKNSEQLEYEKQKILVFKKNSIAQQKLKSFSYIQKQNLDDSSFMLFNGKQDNLQESIFEEPYSSHQQSLSKGHQNIIESLKGRIIREQQAHAREIQQMEEQLFELEQKLKENSHFQQLLVIYQQKYQQALVYMEKVSQYQKQKNKVNQQIIEKNIIIEELKQNIQEINQRLIQTQEEKIDLQLLLAKKNNEKMFKNLSKDIQLLERTNMPENINLRKTQSYACPQINLSSRHHRQMSQQIENHKQNDKLSLSMYPILEQQEQKQIHSLQIAIESKNLAVKRLERRQKQLTKQNESLKGKVEKMRKIQNQNAKLCNIIAELHARKNQETQILVNCLYETYTEFDFKFKNLTLDSTKVVQKTSKYLNEGHLLKENTNKRAQQIIRGTDEFDKLSVAVKNPMRNTSLRIQGNILEVQMQNENSRPNIR